MTDKLLSATIAELEALMAQATPGPWAVREGTYAVHQPEFECWIPADKNDAALIVAAINALPQLIAAARERDDLQKTFDVRWDCDQRAIERWQEATGHKTVWPDGADLTVWLLTELEQAEAARDEALKELKDLAEPRLQSMRMENGHFDMSVCGPIVNRFALAVVAHFREEPEAKNYFSWNIHSSEDPFERYSVTIQKNSGKSPHELRAEAERARDEAIAHTVRLSRELGELQGVADLMQYKSVIEGWRAKCAALEADNARLRDVLKPFALENEYLTNFQTKGDKYCVYFRRDEIHAARSILGIDND